jgi:hypothetical protein
VTTFVPCKGCGQSIAWLEHERTRKPAPIDADPSPNGNVVGIDSTGFPVPLGVATAYRIVGKADRERLARDGESLHLNHFATCEKAARFGSKGER